MRLIQIVPQVPRQIEGVGAYALRLAGALRTEFGIGSSFLVGDATWDQGPSPSVDKLDGVSARSSEALVAGLEGLLRGDNGKGAAVLLHYVGYGYQKRGCPGWLLRGLTRWRRKGRRIPLVTVFHELYAFGPPWRSSFWLSPIQQVIARVVLRLSDAAITSTGMYAARLRQWSSGQGREILRVPVFSSVGEPEYVSDAAERLPVMVVFGTPARRARLYRRAAGSILIACRRLGLTELWDIGVPTETPWLGDGIKVVRMGQLPAEAVSRLLSMARVGFIDLQPASLGKSTVFAAYCAHGLMPVNGWPGSSLSDKLEDGYNLWAADRVGDGGIDLARITHIGRAARAWYGEHALSRQAGQYHALIAGLAPPEAPGAAVGEGQSVPSRP